MATQKAVARVRRASVTEIEMTKAEMQVHSRSWGGRTSAATPTGGTLSRPCAGGVSQAERLELERKMDELAALVEAAEAEAKLAQGFKLAGVRRRASPVR